MFGRHHRLPLDVAFHLHMTSSNVAFSKSRYVDQLQKRLEYAYDEAGSFSEKEAQTSKDRYDRKATVCFLRTW